MSKSGALAEQLAAHYLQQQGLKLLQMNYSCRYGEIDLILQDGDTHVFAEVRLRSGSTFGGAAASIDARKQAKLVRTAQCRHGRGLADNEAWHFTAHRQRPRP